MLEFVGLCVYVFSLDKEKEERRMGGVHVMDEALWRVNALFF